MSFKSLLQFSILLLIILIIGGVYFQYFETKKNIVEEVNISLTENIDQLEEIKKKLSDLELKNQELTDEIESTKDKSLKIKEQSLIEIQQNQIIENNQFKQKKLEIDNLKNNNENQNKKIEKKNPQKKKEIKNFVKNVEYISVDQKGNRFYLLASSGKSNIDNNDILDLENVRGEIKSDKRDTIYITSDYAQYNSSNLNSKFYENVIINYQNKKITCINFDINMETNKAIAYNDVIIADDQSIMKAGVVEFDLKTKNVNINPDIVTTEIELIKN